MLCFGGCGSARAVPRPRGSKNLCGGAGNSQAIHLHETVRGSAAGKKRLAACLPFGGWGCLVGRAVSSGAGDSEARGRHFIGVGGGGQQLGEPR